MFHFFFLLRIGLVWKKDNFGYCLFFSEKGGIVTDVVTLYSTVTGVFVHFLMCCGRLRYSVMCSNATMCDLCSESAGSCARVNIWRRPTTAFVRDGRTPLTFVVLCCLVLSSVRSTERRFT